MSHQTFRTQATGEREAPIDQVAAQRAYDDELIRRYEADLPLTAADTKAARRLIRQRAAEQSAVHIDREHIARLAEADGEHVFAREVRGGCWDHRRDVKDAIATADANIRA